MHKNQGRIVRNIILIFNEKGVFMLQFVEGCKKCENDNIATKKGYNPTTVMLEFYL